MSTLVLAEPLPPTKRQQLIAAAGGVVTLLIAAAFARHAASGQPLAGPPPIWLIIHLATIVPAMPLGAFVLFRRKGDFVHRVCGRIWAALMVIAALSSFGLVSLMGHLSPIHLLSALTLFAVPRAVINARRGRIAAHQRGMTVVYASAVVAGLFVFLPTRLLGRWLFGL